MSDDLTFQRMQQDLARRIGQSEVKEVPIYATGSFVPTLVGAGTAGTFTYTANATIVEWTRIGNRLLFNGRIVITATAVAPVGNMTIRGWPYAGVTDANMAIAGVGDMIWSKVTLPAGYNVIALQFSNDATPALTRSGTNVALATVQGGELTGGVYDFRFGGEYKVA